RADEDGAGAGGGSGEGDAVATALLGSAFPARASLFGGTNYASGGAQTSLNTPIPGSTFSTFSLQSQVNFYLNSLGGASAPSDALYVVQGGANNVRSLLATGAAFNPLTVTQAAAAYASDIGGLIDQLQLAGARHIIVWNTPNAGSTPEALSFGSAASSFATSISSQFNNALATRLAGEVGVKTFDIFGAGGNFSNVTDACGNNASGCGANPQFWDGIHPTAAAHLQIAQGFLALAAPVPEASTYAMFLVGLIGCGWAARRRHC
ncbi:MAG: SGNH/GDSL hydrolase family protein, partial [Burkholderiales bacterium]